MCILTPAEASRGLWIPSPGLQTVGIWFVSAGNDTQVRARAADALNCWAIFPATVFTFVFLVQGIRQYFVEFGFTESTLPRDSLQCWAKVNTSYRTVCRFNIFALSFSQLLTWLFLIILDMFVYEFIPGQIRKSSIGVAMNPSPLPGWPVRLPGNFVWKWTFVVM